jgi:hypothetical protein
MKMEKEEWWRRTNDWDVGGQKNGEGKIGGEGKEEDKEWKHAGLSVNFGEKGEFCFTKGGSK